MNKINAYVFKFMGKSITGKLVEKNGDYITIELKSGSVVSNACDTPICSDSVVYV
jgi:hypothetical protein